MPPVFTTIVSFACPETIPGPDHEYDTGEVVVPATACTVVVVQLSELLTALVTTGSMVFEIIETLAEVEQPVTGFSIATV